MPNVAEKNVNRIIQLYMNYIVFLKTLLTLMGYTNKKTNEIKWYEKALKLFPR